MVMVIMHDLYSALAPQIPITGEAPVNRVPVLESY